MVYHQYYKSLCILLHRIQFTGGIVVLPEKALDE